MSIDDCKEEASHGSVSIQLAVGIAVASSAATVLICAVTWAFCGRHNARRNGRKFKSTIAHDHHKSTEHLHERESSNRQEIPRITSPTALQQTRPPPLLASPLHASTRDGTELFKVQTPLVHSHNHQDCNEVPSRPPLGESCSPNDSTPLEFVNKDHKITPERVPPSPINGYSKASPWKHTPSVYRFAPPESIVRSRQSPPNLTTEYSAVSLSGFAEFAPWASSSVLDGPDDSN